ncbi:hypothetical protein T4C_11759 [Trichinella pseudospiralis]|uniref:Uncharacterized protein n=1 Tax=Trichinella pseudospiralis TaxID=6337 RepID=A0A0V1GPT8_TRIPS|nr:hypothetical protein T4C_11759 [Trichinella pseudospiralis]
MARNQRLSSQNVRMVALRRKWKNLGVAKPNNYVQMLTNVAHEIESACAVSRENGNRLYKEKTSSGN